jgi:hypothetical protein
MTNKNNVFNQIEIELSFVHNAHGECNIYIDFNMVFVTKMSCSNCDIDCNIIYLIALLLLRLVIYMHYKFKKF